MNEASSFGRWIKQRRLALDLTQDVLAERVGCSTQMIRKLEGGERRPSRTMARRLALGLGLPADEHAIFLEAAVGGYAPTPPRHSVAPTGTSRLTHRHNLPTQREPLIGRDRERADVAALLRRSEVGIVTLVGPGGTGKTRLALQLAADLLDDFADGVWFVDLAPISDPAFVAAAIARTLDIAQTSGESLQDTITVFLRDKQMLLLLDNFEQVVPAASLLADLLRSAARLKVLVTSRVVLHLTAEQEYAVPPLALPDLPRRGHPALPLEHLAQYGAVKLFVKRAQGVKPDFAVTHQSAPVVAAICARLDGLPLAIELAAARCKLFTPHALLQRLDRRMEMLTGGARDKETRQQTLRGTLDWSYNLLEMEEQRLFTWLAVFVGGFTIGAAEVVCNGHGNVVHDVFDGLASLVDKSLLRQEEGWDGEPRFRMLETIREYALELLVANGQAEQVQRQHAAFFLALAECAEPELLGPTQGNWLARLEREHDNLRAALRWTLESGAPDTALRLGVALTNFWQVRGYSSEGHAWIAAALDLADVQLSKGIAVTDDMLRAKALLRSAQMSYDCEAQNILLVESLQLFRELGNIGGVAETLRTMGVIAVQVGDNDRATALLTESLSLFRQLEDTLGCARSLMHIAHVQLLQGEAERARALHEEALTLFRAGNNKRGIAWCLIALGEVARFQADYATAGEYYVESLALGRELGHRRLVADALHNLGYVERFRGNYAQAAAYFVESLAQAQELDDPEAVANCLAGLASVMIASGPHEATVRRAVQLLGAVEVVRERLGEAFLVVDREEWNRSISAASAILDEGTFAAAWAEGRALSLEQALAYAI